MRQTWDLTTQLPSTSKGPLSWGRQLVRCGWLWGTAFLSVRVCRTADGGCSSVVSASFPQHQVLRLAGAGCGWGPHSCLLPRPTSLRGPHISLTHSQLMGIGVVSFWDMGKCCC